MKLLLDTHTLIWALEDSPRLPLGVRDAIIDESNQIYVSALSLWEIAIKHKKRADSMPYSASEIKNFAVRSGYIFLSLSLDAISIYDGFDFGVLNDPFDRMLLCQSQANNMRLLTHDEKLKNVGLGFVEAY